ncbi:MAG: OsmC family protein [Alistipes sp.]
MIVKVTLEMNNRSEFVLENKQDCKDLHPKALLLYAAAKCAALTAMSIMQKEHLTPQRFEISVSGELSTDTVQAESIFHSFNVVYNIECAQYNEQVKVSRAVNLAHDKYCGLVRMLRLIAPVAHEIAIVSTQPSNA